MHSNDAGRAKGETAGNDLDELRSRVEALERRTRDLALKGQIVGSQLFGKTGLDRFFAEPEFWENTYDSGQADCSRRCIEELAAANRACEVKPEDERADCYDAAVRTASACHARCAQAFPIPT